MKILIATGIYPPALGGPAQYAYNLETEWKKAGHTVTIKTFNVEHSLPTLVRHFYYFLKIIPAVIGSDFIFALDTFSVGWPATCAAKIFRKKIIMRTGGDFLWEGYVERTGDLVLFKDFYSKKEAWSKKEKLIFRITKWALHNVSILVFSTEWQKNIWMKPYYLESVKTAIVENFYGEKLPSFEPKKKDFIAGTRNLKWKNIDIIKTAFEHVGGAFLDLNTYKYDEFMRKISECYAVALVSLGDISPNTILEAIRHNKPFIVTVENGLMDRIKDIALVVNPKDPRDIATKAQWLLDPVNYHSHIEKIKAFNFTHTWEQIAGEIISLYKTL